MRLLTDSLAVNLVSNIVEEMEIPKFAKQDKATLLTGNRLKCMPEVNIKTHRHFGSPVRNLNNGTYHTLDCIRLQWAFAYSTLPTYPKWFSLSSILCCGSLLRSCTISETGNASFSHFFTTLLLLSHVSLILCCSFQGQWE